MEIADFAGNRNSPAVRWIAPLILVLVTTGVAQSQSEVGDAKGPKPCGVSITKCGCTITAPGFYDVAAPDLLDVTLNKDNSCIAIKASNVVLALDGKMIGGAGAGIGIHVLPGANNSFIEGGGGTISGWDTGIMVEANNAVIENLSSNGNATTGIELNKARNVTVTGTTSNSNGKNGIWLNSSSSSQVIGSAEVESNKGPGILIGCTSGCPKSAGSNQNRILSNMLVTKNQSGIMVAAGSQHNVITNNAASMNSPGDDLMDSNNDCGTNLWFNNGASPTAEPATCVH
jgi:hypothetical protein